MLVNAEHPVLIADNYGARRRRRSPGQLASCSVRVIDTSAPQQCRRAIRSIERPARGQIRAADVVWSRDERWKSLNSYRDQLHRNSDRSARRQQGSYLGPGDLYMERTMGLPALRRCRSYRGGYRSHDTRPHRASEASDPPAQKTNFEARGRSSPPITSPMCRRAAHDLWLGCSPITTAPLVEVWAQIRMSPIGAPRPIDVQLLAAASLDMDKNYHFLGDGGGMSIGYCASASCSNMANRKHSRLTVAISRRRSSDDDRRAVDRRTPQIPVLWVVHNNRGYHQEVMHVQRLAARHMRGLDRAHIGTTLRDPNIDYAKVAEGMGCAGIGPITDPKDLAAALRRGIDIVKRGEPCLIDVVTQGR
jgi:hypothetical protein